jgi:succinate dehydrogenase / fumarate reductase membrane anchor subunit
VLFGGLAFLLYPRCRAESPEGLAHVRAMLAIPIAARALAILAALIFIVAGVKHLLLDYTATRSGRASRRAGVHRGVGGPDRSGGSLAMVRNVTSLSRSGLSDFVIQRVSAVVLLVYTLCVTGFLVANPGIGYNGLLAYFVHPAMQVFSTLTVLAIATHAWIGVDRRHRLHPRPLLGAYATVFRASFELVCSWRCSFTSSGASTSSGDCDHGQCAPWSSTADRRGWRCRWRAAPQLANRASGRP